jgi:glyoxylase-like metal-dependent hydrolase (beta-lactamase superfamily II)
MGIYKSSENQAFEIFALKLGDMEVDSPTVFYQTDFGKRILKSFYFFCLKNKDHTILLDTGASQDELEVRGMFNRPSPKELLKRININTDDVETIILTHLHGDHFSESESFSRSIFYASEQSTNFGAKKFKGFMPYCIRHLLKGNRLSILKLCKS